MNLQIRIGLWTSQAGKESKSKSYQVKSMLFDIAPEKTPELGSARGTWLADPGVVAQGPQLTRAGHLQKLASQTSQRK